MTATAPVPSEGRRPLGEVLVDRGIVTPEQLRTALEQQRSTGKQLGEIIVALGFAPGPIVAQALATQHGGMIKTEYGFAMGWSSDEAPSSVAPRAEVDSSEELAQRDRAIAELRAWSEQAQTAIDSRDDAIARLQAALAEQRATPDEALQSLEVELRARAEELDAVRAELRAESDRHASTQTKLAASSEAAALRAAELAALTEAAALHDAQAARAVAAQAASERELATVRRTVADLERRLENARSRADTLARRITEQDQELEALRTAPLEEPDRWSSATAHYVLRRSSEGYDLVARDGPPPAVGDTVDGLRVARVGPVGPGLDIVCAYLAD